MVPISTFLSVLAVLRQQDLHVNPESYLEGSAGAKLDEKGYPAEFTRYSVQECSLALVQDVIQID
jgi:hypothetical protein